MYSILFKSHGPIGVCQVKSLATLLGYVWSKLHYLKITNVLGGLFIFRDYISEFRSTISSGRCYLVIYIVLNFGHKQNFVQKSNVEWLRLPTPALDVKSLKTQIPALFTSRKAFNQTNNQIGQNFLISEPKLTHRFTVLRLGK